MNICKYFKCLFVGHNISNSKSIVETFNSNNWIKKCKYCGVYIMNGDLGSIDISEKQAFKIKNELDEMKKLYNQKD